MVVWERVKNSCYLRMYLLCAYVVYILYLRRYCIIFSSLFMFFFILKVDGDKKMIIFVNYQLMEVLYTKVWIDSLHIDR